MGSQQSKTEADRIQSLENHELPCAKLFKIEENCKYIRPVRVWLNQIPYDSIQCEIDEK